MSLNSLIGAVPIEKLGVALPIDEIDPAEHVLVDQSGEIELDRSHLAYEEGEEAVDGEYMTFCDIELMADDDSDEQVIQPEHQRCRRASAGGGGRGGSGSSVSSSSSSKSGSSSSSKSGSSSSGSGKSTSSGTGAGTAAGAGAGAGAAGAAGRNRNNGDNKTSDALPTRLTAIDIRGIHGPMLVAATLCFGAIFSLTR
ncbi:uncharacterized protein I303_101317 [Kwoniella dejecticola CBS 10117]|uniref:Uncharacterized protein n=1 Tax=Kwoniella dejecticola CBS 10117 TaxID=1296121 RepID=A0A1A6AHL1_9TREE|nr:uncharacterized protein I303_01326 [Kwoniella dejecticola CBS 10117]OBR89498.1 hypothetical protein I303_01326 [Kwoniella dejecticola CBS 10117]